MITARVEALAHALAEEAFAGWIDDDPGSVPPRPDPDDYADRFAAEIGDPERYPELYGRFYDVFEAQLDALSREPPRTIAAVDGSRDSWEPFE